MKHALLMAGMVGIGAALGLGLAPASHAETGTKPHIDNLCTAPAFVATGPVVIIRNDVRQERTFNQPLVGIRAGNDYCSGPDVVLPPGYGSGPDELVP